MMTAMASMTILEVSCLVPFFGELHLLPHSLAGSQLLGLHACVLKCLSKAASFEPAHCAASQLPRDRQVALCQISPLALQLVVGC